MSLTSQIKDKKSNVSIFFKDFEEKDGMKIILNEMKQKEVTNELKFKAESPLVTGSYLGMMADLFFRMIIGKDSFDLMETIAFKDGRSFFENSNNDIIINLLRDLCESANYGNCKNIIYDDCLYDFVYEISKYGLSYDKFCNNCIFNFTCFAVIEAYYRSWRFPKIFKERTSGITLLESEFVETKIGEKWMRVAFYEDEENKKMIESKIIESYFEFYKMLGGDKFSKELLDIINEIKKSTQGSLLGMEMIISNGIPKNSFLVGGADFDAIIGDKTRNILVEIKTIRKTITMNSIRQILGYILLIDNDGKYKSLSHAGFYYPITGEFNYYDIEHIVKTALPKFETVDEARGKFIEYCKK